MLPTRYGVRAELIVHNGPHEFRRDEALGTGVGAGEYPYPDVVLLLHGPLK